MASLNKVMLIGNLGADPEMRDTQDGRRFATFRMAMNEKWKDRAGNPQERTEWTTVVVYAEGLAKVVERFLKKGSQVYVEGKMQTRKWQDKSGADRWTTEVVLNGFSAALVMLDGAGGNRPPPGSAADYAGPGSDRDADPAPADLDDEIPF